MMNDETCIVSSGNPFADVGLPNPEERFALTLIHKFLILPTSAGVQGTESPDGVSGCPRNTSFLFSRRLRRREKKEKVGRPHTP